MHNLKEQGEFIVGCSQQAIMFATRFQWNDETLVKGSLEMELNIKQLNLLEPWGFVSRLFG
jgi:hypothetical protein